MKMSNRRVINDTGFDTMLEADRNANGIANIAPIIVPKKAIAIVSTSKYGTPFAKSIKRVRSGLTIPDNMLIAILRPLASKLSKSNDDKEHINKIAIKIETTVI